jgi:hypothetical protein
MSRVRYVVLRHEGFGEPHYDLMIESAAGGALHTWRTLEWPIEEAAKLVRLGEHRRLYLDYEGPVSHDRGHVKRAGAGTCEMEWRGEGECVVRFEDETGPKFVLRHIQGQDWSATRAGI